MIYESRGVTYVVAHNLVFAIDSSNIECEEDTCSLALALTSCILSWWSFSCSCRAFLDVAALFWAAVDSSIVTASLASPIVVPGVSI